MRRSKKQSDKKELTGRASGILLPVSSLPSPYGIGSLGKEAFQFIDFLKDTGQKYWQILPIGPTGCGDSPYQSFSAFAANPYFIDPELLVEQGLLKEEELREFQFGDDPEQVDYKALFDNRFRMLRMAADRFPEEEPGFHAFQRSNAGWLEDYALFMALKEENDMVSFQEWPDELRLRKPAALRAARVRLEKEIRFWKVTQYLFFSQWSALKTYAHKQEIYIIGDLPIYVSPDSSDLWAHSELFQVDKNRRPTDVAGCPPDSFTADGQLWGNPLYAWEKHASTGFRWWIRRLSSAAKVYDVVRIDHFRGFAGYYSVPAGSKNAVHGTWRKGPGIDFVHALKEKLPHLSVIAEDLGFLTDDVRELLAESGFPGMKVLQFAFDSREESDYLPHNYIRNCVVYTGTHDNTTTEDWQQTAPKEDVAFARKYLGIGPEDDFTGAMIRAAQASVANTCIIPLQDYLHLGAEARMNTPGTVGGNWRWRVRKEDLTPWLAAEIRDLTELYGRVKREKPKKRK
ncbi:4-alpha-glucanotransferase [Caproiciproducens sp. LBM24188]